MALSKLWAVYCRLDGCGYVVCRLCRTRDGTYSPRVRRGTPPIQALPVTIRTGRRVAETLAAALAYGCSIVA